MAGKSTCNATAKSTGEQCGRTPHPGADKCVMHGGRTDRAKERAGIDKTRRFMVREAIKPIPVDDPEADPIEGTAVEYRRTIAWIRYCETILGELEDRHDEIIWGLSQRVEKDGFEAGELVALVETRYAAGINKWVELLQWNRKHADNIAARWVQNGLDMKRLQIEAALVTQLDGFLDQLLRSLGRDPADPEVRGIVETAFDATLGAYTMLPDPQRAVAGTVDAW